MESAQEYWAARAALEWQVELGADEALSEGPVNRFELVEKVKAMVLMADTPDKDIAKFLWEQLFGKATQRSEITGAEGEALQILFDNSFDIK